MSGIFFLKGCPPTHLLGNCRHPWRGREAE